MNMDVEWCGEEMLTLGKIFGYRWRKCWTVPPVTPDVAGPSPLKRCMRSTAGKKFPKTYLHDDRMRSPVDFRQNLTNIPHMLMNLNYFLFNVIVNHRNCGPINRYSSWSHVFTGKGFSIQKSGIVSGGGSVCFTFLTEKMWVMYSSPTGRVGLPSDVSWKLLHVIDSFYFRFVYPGDENESYLFSISIAVEYCRH